MRIVIANTHVPYVRGGAELLAEQLQQALVREGHEVDIVRLPFRWNPPEQLLAQMLSARLADLSEANGVEVDLLVGLKFPAYLIPHKRKVLWILHQHRQAYDQWDRELGDIILQANGKDVREAIYHADRLAIRESRHAHTISANVSRRLSHYMGLEAPPLWHPPPAADLFFSKPSENFLFFPSRLNAAKRQELVVNALAQCQQPVRVLFAGKADNAPYAEELLERVRLLKLTKRVEMLGEISDEEKRDLYARCLGVVFPPLDEDYGYITLEAMLAAKPVITCTDSGGPLDFIIAGKTGLVCEPTAEALARAMDELWSDRSGAARMGEAARDHYGSLHISWSTVVEALLA